VRSASGVDAELRPAACAVRSRPQDGAAQARDIERRFGVGLDEHVFFASPGRRRSAAGSHDNVPRPA
jgi:phosphate-selective porin